MRLSKQIDAARIRTEGEAAAIIDSIAAIAQDLNMLPQKSRLMDKRGQLRTSPQDEPKDQIFKIVVCGRFRNGKSTFLNALLGKATGRVALPAGEKGPMPTADAIPTTATLTRVCYSKEPYVRAWRIDNTSEEWSFQRYLREARLWVGTNDNKRLFEDIKLFEVGYPAELLQSGVTLVDSPGMDENPGRTEMTRAAIKDAHAAIVVYRSEPFAGEGEQSFAAEVTAHSGKTFTIINRFNGRVLDPQFRAMAAQRLDLDDPQMFINDPAVFDVYGVDARVALDASVDLNTEQLEHSGMAAFEARLSAFLLQERYPTYIESIVKQIDDIAAKVEEGVKERHGVACADRVALDSVLEECRINLNTIEQRQERIGHIVERTKRQAARIAVDSFRNFVADLVEEMPEEFAKTPIPSLKNIGDKLQALVRKKFVEDAVEVLNGILTRRLRAWAEEPPPARGLQADIEPVLDDMRKDIVMEIEAIDKELANIRLKIGGLDPHFKHEAGHVVGMLQRLAWAGYGLITHDYLTGLTGSTTGVHGIAGGLAGAIAAGVAIGVITTIFSTVLAPFTLIALIWAGWTAGGIAAAVAGIESRIRKLALKGYDKKLRELRTESKIEQLIVNHLNDALAKLNDEVKKMVDGVVADERGNIEELRRIKKLDRAQQEGYLAKLEPAVTQIRRSRESLKELHARIRQTN